MKKIRNPLIGTDIELFVMEKETGRVISAEGYVKGSKHKPFRFDPMNEHFSTSLDNVALEFTIPPSQTMDEWRDSINKAIAYSNSILPEHLCTAALPAADLEDVFLQTKNAKLIGCDVSYLVWSRSIAEKPDISKLSTRTTGLHIHFGYDEPTQEVNEDIVKTFDLLVTVPSTLIEPDNKRRELYGEAGEFRFKPYGVECRTLSSHFAGSDELIDWTYKGANRVIDFINEGNMELVELRRDDILQAINGKCKKTAKRIVDEFEIELV